MSLPLDMSALQKDLVMPLGDNNPSDCAPGLITLDVGLT